MHPEIKIFKNSFTAAELTELAEQSHVDFAKAVVDIEKKWIAIGGSMHADAETLLLEEGSSQNDLWGINLYVDSSDENMIEFDSLINIRPLQNNRGRDIEDETLRQRIVSLVMGAYQK